MAEQGNSGRPRRPGDAVTEIVRYGTSASPRGGVASLVVGLVWCVLGGLSCVLVPVLAPAVAAYGVVLVVFGRRPALWVAAAAASVVPAVILGMLTDPTSLPQALVSCLAALAVAGLVAGDRVSVSRECAVILAVAAFLFATDEWAARTVGTTLSAALSSSFDAVAADYVSQASVETAAQLPVMRSLFMTFWPMIYLVMAGITVLCGHWGARSGFVRSGGVTARPFSFEAFVVPAWVVVAFACGVVAVAAGKVSAGWPDQVVMAATNACMAARLVFALDGLAVLSWFLVSKRVGPVVRFFVLLVAANLEVSFMVMSVVGLLDVWANFRHLPRGRKTTVQGSAQ